MTDDTTTDRDTDSDEGGLSITRRGALITTGGLMISLAGCATVDEEETPTEGGSGVALPPRLTPPSGGPPNEVWGFVIDSLDYQNRALEQIAQGD